MELRIIVSTNLENLFYSLFGWLLGDNFITRIGISSKWGSGMWNIIFFYFIFLDHGKKEILNARGSAQSCWVDFFLTPEGVSTWDERERRFDAGME